MGLLTSYETFLLSNASQIVSVESSLRSVTWFLPGRFKDAELAGEAIYSALNLLGIYHDSILKRLLRPQPVPRPEVPPPARNRQQLSIPTPDSSLVLPDEQPTHTPSSHARYTHHFADASSAYNAAARSLVVIGYVELLAEMLARRKLGRERRWDVVLGIEGTKAALRLTLLHLTGHRPSIQPPIPEREVDPVLLEEERQKALDRLQGRLPAEQASQQLIDATPTASTSVLKDADFWRGSRTGLTRETLVSMRRKGGVVITPSNARSRAARSAHPLVGGPGSNAPALSSRSGSGSDSSAEDSDSDETLVEPLTDKEVSEYLMSKVLTPTDVSRPQELVRRLQGKTGYVAELVWILRPLIYVVALRRYGRRARLPFFVSLILEFLARILRARSLVPRNSASTEGNGAASALAAMMGGVNPVLGYLAKTFMGGASEADKARRPISDVEKSEWDKRDRAFYWYLLRGPLWDSWTKPKLEGIVRRTENRRILGMLGGILRDYLPLVDEYYYYSAT